MSQIPDFVVRFRLEPARGGHLQSALVLRQIRADLPDTTTDDIIGVAGYGLTVSGKVFLRRRFLVRSDVRDNVTFQVIAGKGIGRYVKDLDAEGGQDAFFDSATGEIEALRAFAWYVGAQHWWSEKHAVRTTTTFGAVSVNNLDAQPPDSYERTRRWTGNLSWSPIPQIDLVFEVLGGERINKDGGRGRASQIQLGTIFRF